MVRDKFDFRPIPPQYLGESRVEYYVPCRRLSDSEIAIAKLVLPAMKSGKGPVVSTPNNRHPGFELLLALEGAVELDVSGMSARIDSRKSLFAHFQSEKLHRVVNVGPKESTVLVIRFYR